MKYFATIVFLAALLFLGDCSSDLKQPEIVRNLQVETTISSDGSGVVELIATAENATNYVFLFGEGHDTPVVSLNGAAAHTYSETGTYTIKITAYDDKLGFLTISRVITVIVADKPIQDVGYSTPLTYDGMSLVWHDEFDQTVLDNNEWNYELGTNNGWGNAELENYQMENTKLQDGFLVITAKEALPTASAPYTSSRITTKESFQYGRIDIRAKVPTGQGVWPALWMLGDNVETVGWPASGEIDIMEKIGGVGHEGTVYGTAHWDDSGHQMEGGETTLSGGELLTNEFHVYSIKWDESSITWYLDDVSYKTVAITAERSELRTSSFFIFNVAVGGTWPGNPDATTSFPQRMVVDYVRVFQEL